MRGFFYVFFPHAGAGAAASALITALGATAAYAQQTTAAVAGVARDLDGKPIAGATVTAIHTTSGVKLTTVSDAQGHFDLRGLEVGGPYTIIAAASGYDQQSVDGLYLTVGSEQQVALTLAASHASADITVTAKKRTGVLAADVGSRTTIRSNGIEGVVTPKRDLRDIGRRDPLAQLDFVTRGTGPTGGLYIAGSLPRSNRITIDGVRSQDDFGLNTGGLSTNRGPISLEAIEQVSIQAAPFDVQEGDFTGGAINMITKAGSNDFHGTVFGFTRTGRDVGTELPFTTVTKDSSGDLIGPSSGVHKVSNYVNESNEGLFLSGPILRDRLFFAGSYERYESSQPVGAGPAGAGFSTSFAPIPLAGGGTTPATAAEIGNVLSGWNSYAASSKLSPGVVSSSWPVQDEKASARVDWFVTDGQHLTVTWRRAFSEVEKGTPSSNTGIYLDTNTYAQPETENNYSIQLNSQWLPNLSTEARLSYREYQRGQTPPEGQNFSSFTICTTPADPAAGTSTILLNSCAGSSPKISFGPDQFRQANVLNTRDAAGEFVANYRPFDGHLVKFGYQYKGIHIYDLFVQQAHGVYTFGSQADFNNGLADQLQYGSAFSGNAADAAAELAYKVHSLFAQDSWDVAPGLNVNYGLRYDIYQSDSVPLLNANFQARYGYTNQKTYDGLSVLMPRFSAKWRTDWFELSGGIGRVSGGLPDVFITNSFGANTGAATNAINIVRLLNPAGSATPYSYEDLNTGATIDPAIGASILNLDKSNAGLASNPAAAALTLLGQNSANLRLAYTNSLAPNFQIPADWKANIAFVTKKFDFDWRVDAVFTQSDTTIAFRDLRARLLTQNGVQLYTPDGRLRYDGLNLSAATRAADGLPVSTNTDLTNVGLTGDIQAYNPHKQNFSHTVAFTVARKWGGLDGSLSYVLQGGQGLVGISEFGTTEGGNSTSGNYYSDQTFGYDPNGAASGRSNNLIENAIKVNVDYKVELAQGFPSIFTLFGEWRNGRPINFLFSDPLVQQSGRSSVFGVSRDDALLYVPNLSSPVAGNPLEFTSSKGTTVFFDSQASLNSFTQLVRRFGIPQGGIVPRGVGHNPDVFRLDFQWSQEVPVPLLHGHRLIATLDIANLPNLIDSKWGVVKEYGGSRNGVSLVNVQCATASGQAVANSNPTCAAYRYSYSTVSPTSAASPTVDPNSLFSVVFGLKYKF